MTNDGRLIELHHVSRSFGPHIALHDVTLSLPPGRVGLLGPNGAGKSTLLKLLMGLIPPSSGTGRVLDEELGGDPDADRAGEGQGGQGGGEDDVRRLHGISSGSGGPSWSTDPASLGPGPG